MSLFFEDRALLDAFRRGESTALAHVYREYAGMLFAFLANGFVFEGSRGASVFKGVREPWAREEAVQEIFARAFSPPARVAYDGIRPYRNYLLTIARNHLLDSLRRGGREVLVSEPVEDDAPSAAAQADELAGSRELSGHCETFVRTLDPEERRLFESRFRGGLSIEQTAKALGVTEHRAKKTEALLRKRFFVHMKSLGYFDGLGYGRDGLRRLKLGMLLLLGTAA